MPSLRPGDRLEAPADALKSVEVSALDLVRHAGRLAAQTDTNTRPPAGLAEANTRLSSGPDSKYDGARRRRVVGLGCRCPVRASGCSAAAGLGPKPISPRTSCAGVPAVALALAEDALLTDRNRVFTASEAPLPSAGSSPPSSPSATCHVRSPPHRLRTTAACGAFPPPPSTGLRPSLRIHIFFEHTRDGRRPHRGRGRRVRWDVLARAVATLPVERLAQPPDCCGVALQHNASGLRHDKWQVTRLRPSALRLLGWPTAALRLWPRQPSVLAAFEGVIVPTGSCHVSCPVRGPYHTTESAAQWEGWPGALVCNEARHGSRPRSPSLRPRSPSFVRCSRASKRCQAGRLAHSLPPLRPLLPTAGPPRFQIREILQPAKHPGAQATTTGRLFASPPWHTRLFRRRQHISPPCPYLAASLKTPPATEQPIPAWAAENSAVVPHGTVAWPSPGVVSQAPYQLASRRWKPQRGRPVYPV